MKVLWRGVRTALAFLACLAMVARGQSAPSPAGVPSLSSSGQGEAKVKPDRASIVVVIQSRAATAAAASTDNAQRTRSVLDVVGKLGLPAEQMSTESYTVYPEMQYDKAGGSAKVTGYVVANSIRVETHRPEQAGTIVDAALGAGANMINGLSFYASSIEEARRQAIDAAVASARADAAAMAVAAGGTLGDLLELSTSGPTTAPRPMFNMATSSALARQSSEPTPLNGGLQTVSVFVNARWQFVARR